MDKPLKNEVEKWVTSRVADRDFFLPVFRKTPGNVRAQ